MFKMKFIPLFACSLLVSSSFVFGASTTSSEEADASTHESVINQKPFGDAQAGKNKAAACGACHGRDGNSGVANYPKLAGQSPEYLYKQMMDFKSGARLDAVMPAQVSGRSEQDLKDIAAYYAAQEPTSGLVKKSLVELGQKIYRGGNSESGLPACIACHGPAGKGMSSAGFPALAGQHSVYTASQLERFRAAGRGDHVKDNQKRNNDSVDGGPAMMQDVAAKMTDDEIEAVSSYIQGLR